MNVKTVPRIKTIKMGLKPMWETKQNIKPYISKQSQDSMRKEQYFAVKEILNRYARDVIRESTEEVSTSGMNAMYEKMQKLYAELKNKKSKEAKKEYEKAVNDFKKYIVTVVKKYADKYQLSKAQAVLFNEKKSVLMNEYGLSESERELISSYNGFTSCFKKYFASLTEVILFGVSYGSISDRIVENMEIYFENEDVLQTIKENKKELYNTLKEKIFKYDISLCMSQSGIDIYNSLLGNVDGDGVNTLISEYKQQHKEKVSMLKKMKKIPLEKQEKQIFLKQIESKEELEDVFEEFISLSKMIMNFAQKSVHTLLLEDKEDVYISENKISALSMMVYGKWHLLSSAINNYQKVFNIKHEEGDAYSLSLIEKAIEFFECDTDTTLINAIKKSLLEVVSARKLLEQVNCKKSADEIVSNKKYVKKYGDLIVSFYRATTLFELSRNESVFISDIIDKQDELHELIGMYNLIRNYLTRNPIQIKEWDITFNKSTFLSSFDYDKFKDGATLSTILKKDDLYYFMILNPAYGNKIRNSAYTRGKGFQQLVYKQLIGLNKMFPKCFLSEKGKELYKPSEEIKRIVKEKLYTKEANDKESLTKWIEFCIECFSKNKEWSENFSPNFRNPYEYESANEFYTEIEQSMIRMDFSKTIKEDYIREAVKNGEIFLFQIYNKDFSQYHTGNDSPYVKILKELFSEENLVKLNETNETAIKLASGGSKFIYRPASIPYHVTHEANEPVVNKNPLNSKRESVFSYPLCKDKRYMFDSFHISIAVQLGFRNKDISKYELNRKVNKWVLEEKPNVLTVRTGEKNLLYYMVGDFNGNIIEEGSLNMLVSENKHGTIKTDYKELLISKEREIIKAKEEWNYCKKISDIKQGYMSLAVTEVIRLQKKYNAIILLENYSSSFIFGRQKNLKNVYQKFQKTLLQRLSCYVPNGEKYSNAIQLAFEVGSLDDLKNQSGIVYFINPSYTSCTDYITGFVNQLTSKFVYENKKQAEKVFSMTNIEYDSCKKEYLIGIDEKDFGTSKTARLWKLHSSGDRTIFEDNKVKYFDCTEELHCLFKTYNILDSSNAKLDKLFYEKYFKIIRIMLKMHYTDIDSGEEYSLSSIVDDNCQRLDTRRNSFVKNSTAVKTYLLYKKGLMNLECIDEENYFVNKDKSDDYKEDWIRYICKTMS